MWHPDHPETVVFISSQDKVNSVGKGWRVWAATLAGALGALTLLSSCMISPGVQGSGKVISQTRDVSGLWRVKLSGMGNLDVQPGDSDSLIIEAEDNLLPYIKSDVQDGLLTLHIDGETTLAPTLPITYHLTVRSLQALELSGVGNALVENLHTGAFTARVSGAGNLRVTGQAERQDVQVSGVGHYQADALDSRTATVTVSGSGSARVMVTDLLDAHVSGSGDIEYIGAPAVERHINGEGEIRQR
jgi:hypothetical protein